MTINGAGASRATSTATASANRTGVRLRLDPTRCTGHGLCAELLGERVTLDEWGYPIIADRGLPEDLIADARRAVTDCPALALRLDGMVGGRRG